MRQQLVQLGNGAHTLAVQILGNVDDAADAVQDAMITALARPGMYDAGKGPLKPWFMRVVRNRCLDMLRRRKDRGVSVDEVPAREPGPEQSASAAETGEQIREALRAISIDKSEIIVLRDYLDMSYVEIAGILGVAVGTVMSRLHRARLALKEVLEKHDR